ncbi:MAG: carboxylesterase/lipase family protein [Pseudomonadota bacterium]
MTPWIGRRQFLGGTAVAGLGLAAARSANAEALHHPVVATRSGPVAGQRLEGVVAFKGIPYAAPPTGDLRFAPPRPPAPWTEVRDAAALGHPAVQMPSASAASPTSDLGRALQAVFPVAADVAAQSEDCLVLNVWTPKPDRGKRPVMVWLHGGGFAYGSAGWPMYDGANLAARGEVVVVGVNHRLNVFGYVQLDAAPGSGNAGMLDLVAALEWVRDNIAAFGGDPDNVTLFGESGGGAKVSYLLAMPRARGLFHKAIVQSGPGVRAVPIDRARALAADLFAELGLAAGDVAALRAVPADRLIRAAYAAEAKQPGAGFDRSGFSPVVDGDILPRHPWDPDAPDTARDVPVLIGINKDEMTLFMASAPWFGRLDEAGLDAMAQATFGARAPAVLAALRRDFPGDSPTYLATHLTTYGRMFAGSVQIAERKAGQGGARAWMYLLEWETPVGPFRAPHTLEIPLVFDTVETSRPLLGPGPEPQVMAAQMSAAWLAFARNGDPNTPLLPRWPAYDAADRPVMVFNLTSRVVNDPYAATRAAVTQRIVTAVP